MNKIYYVCKYTPIELLESLGGECENFNHMPEGFDLADQVSHPNICGFGKTLLEGVMEGKIKELVLVSCCDTIRSVYDILLESGKLDFLYILDVLHCDSDCSRERMAVQLKGLAKAYAQYKGTEFDAGKFRAAFHAQEKITKSHIAVLGARMGQELFEMTSKAMPLPVENDTCVHNRSVGNILPPEGASFDELMDWYAGELLGQIPCMRMMDPTGRKKLYNDPSVAGIIYHTVKFCDFYSFEYAEIKNHTDVPLLKIESDYTIQSSGQLLTRLEAFAESIQPETLEQTIDGDTKGERKMGKGYFAGIDSGSTSTDVVILNKDHEIVTSIILPTGAGAAIGADRALAEALKEAGLQREDIDALVTTGYGRTAIKNGDKSITEITCHARGAHFLNSEVRTVIDIGGQDIKCFKIANNCIDNISLNEACSSGCGSFIETFARSMGYSIEEFCRLGLFAEHPIDLGSRCTVFMNSSVKQAQKVGAGIDAISAGLSVSVVKNALYKVIRAHSPDDLGKHIVVQGGTFLNDAILRSFEMEIGRNVTRPVISGLMGAYGAALHAMANEKETSTLISLDELKNFTHKTTSVKCGMCTNHCSLTGSLFPGGLNVISGNRCERPLGGGDKLKLPNLYEYKLNRLQQYRKSQPGKARIGIPFGLNMFELLPFWHTFLTHLDFEVVLSDVSTRAMYAQGQNSIPSDTVCYPAKLMHGHIENLLSKGVDAIFYPCMTYNLDEHRTANCYNCPVVAYYPELLKANMSHLQGVDFMMPYIELDRKKDFLKTACALFVKKYPHINKKMVKQAAEAGYAELDRYYADIAAQGKEAIAYAEEHGLEIAVLAGRPYHIDPEINHGIDRLIQSYNMVIVSEDAVAPLAEMPTVNVLNQWTYHSRMYAAANWAVHRPDAQLVQLVSFGCGIDAVTTDEMRAITEEGGKIYTQLKIDEINNLGAAKIRIRSMLAAVEEGKQNARNA